MRSSLQRELFANSFFPDPSPPDQPVDIAFDDVTNELFDRVFPVSPAPNALSYDRCHSYYTFPTQKGSRLPDLMKLILHTPFIMHLFRPMTAPCLEYLRFRRISYSIWGFDYEPPIRIVLRNFCLIAVCERSLCFDRESDRGLWDQFSDFPSALTCKRFARANCDLKELYCKAWGTIFADPVFQKSREFHFSIEPHAFQSEWMREITDAFVRIIGPFWDIVAKFYGYDPPPGIGEQDFPYPTAPLIEPLRNPWS
jgi:hypothetical protein